MNPLFIPTGDLRQDIASLLGVDTPQLLSRPALQLRNWGFVRVQGLSRFWENERHLRQVTEDLLAGLYGHGAPFAYLTLGEGHKLAVYWGLGRSASSPYDTERERGGGDGDHLLASLLRGSLPGVMLACAKAAELAQCSTRLPHGALMTGIPTVKEGEQLERVLRGLGSAHAAWAYLVMAQPLPQTTITQTFERLAEEIRRVKNTYLRRSSVEEDNHPLAKYYLELLEAALGKYKQARIHGAWETRALLLASDEAQLEHGLTLLAASFSGEKSLPQPIRFHRCLAIARSENPFPNTVLNTPDLSLLVQLPKEELPGYCVFPDHRFAIDLPKALKHQHQRLALGRVLNRYEPTGEWLELDTQDLAKHTFITGTTGSGKTESCLFLLDQLWREQGIPFLVIEPAKQEYRALRGCEGYERLKLFTLGNESEAPFRMNPFEVPQGIHVQTHIDLLRSLFNASFAGLYAPMPYLLEEALYEIYLERGWDLASNKCSQSHFQRFPTLSDLCAKVEEVVERAGYDPEVTQNVQTALRVRLNSLKIGAKGLMLDTQRSVPMEELLGSPAVLELVAIGDPEVVAFLMGLLWLRLYEHRFAQGPSSLKHITLLEEAHRLLARQIQFSGHPEVSNVRAQAVEVFCNMLAELRAFGEGFIIVDQSPTKLHPDVLKNTNLKLVHRLVAKEDREAIGGCTNMSESQMRALATLITGQAAAYAEGFIQPFLVQIPPFRAYALNPQIKGGRADEPGA